MATPKVSRPPPVVFYRYDASPFAGKIENVLALKGIPHHRVEVAMTLPRPEITDMLGINYRRIPVLAIGNDVYCDTSIIAPALERHFPPSEGYPTIFPPRTDGGKADTGMIKALAMFYTDRVIFPLAASSLPYKKFSPQFLEDRGKWFGSPLDVEKMYERQPVSKSQLASHLSLLEEQLSDDREWAFGTVAPGYGDLSLFTIYGWVLYFKNLKDVMNEQKFPRAIAWVKRVEAFVKTKRDEIASSITQVKGDEAAKLISNSATLREDRLPFEEDEAQALGLRPGEQVSVVPDDNAKNYPTTGKLIGLSREEVVLQLQGSAVPSLRCHFPRLNFSIVKMTSKL